MIDWHIFTPFVVPLIAFFGLLVGSFLNVVIYRTPIMMQREWTVFAKEHLNLPLSESDLAPFNWVRPGSHCPSCSVLIKPWQNIPIFSYLAMRGKCASCGQAIGKRYVMVELLTALLFAVVAELTGWSWITLGGLVLTAFLLALTFIDADTQYLPDQLTLPLVWLGLIFNFKDGLVSLDSSVLGAILGYGSLWLLCKLYYLTTGKIGMGGGDFKLLAALGAWLGVAALPVVIFAASLIGLLIAVLTGVQRDKPFPFGPSLALAGWLAFVMHNKILYAVAWWLHASGFSQ